MKLENNLSKYLLSGALFGLFNLTLPAQEEPTELEAFIAEETAAEDSASLMPTERNVDSVLFSGMSLMDLPRTVTVLSPEAMEQFQLDDVYDLANVVPGASVTNYYGVPGIPTTRGLFTSIYFNGVQRVWNRNGYPTSFGSLEAMDYVKGPPPATYSAASPGGFVNFIPKSPYFDEFRGSFKLTIGSWDKYKAQLDAGGPMLIGETPAAYRVSITGQEADSYYDGITDDYFSVYASMKVRISDTMRLFLGGEYYAHRSKEIIGWNRVTQDLIDHGEYITGNPATDLTGDEFSYTLADGSELSFTNLTPGTVNRPALATASPFGGTKGNFDGSFLALSGFTSEGFDPSLYGDNVGFYRALGGLDNPGDGVTTEQISGSTVLTDPDDFADADTYLFFADLVVDSNPDLSVTYKFFIDGYEREKESTYGYGEYGENFTIENKLIIEQMLDMLEGATLSYGASVRYEDALSLTDFTVEPFSRRDITQPIGGNTILVTGSQVDESGTTQWDPFGSFDTQMWNFGAFVNGSIAVTEAFSLIAGARWDHATWDRAVPFGLGADFNSGDLDGGGKSYTNFSISPTYRISDDVSVYYTYQIGTAFQGYYVSGSVSEGDTNFQESSLHELGLRASALDGSLYTSATFFYQDLTNFDDRGGIAIPQRGSGVEFELTWLPTEKLTVRTNLTWQEHHYRADTLPGGFVPLSPEELVDFAGIFYADFGGRPNPDDPIFGIPEWSGSLFLKYDFGNGFGISGGPRYVDSVYGNPDHTLKLPSFVEFSGSLFWENDTWKVMLSGQNLTDEDIFYAGDSFASNAIILKQPSTSYSLAVTYKF
ncbi:MAG: TonB-dependent receptor [Oceanipulchritudo sp.]